MNNITEEQAVTQLLPILMQVDRRLSCHSFSLVEPFKFEHVEVKCPLCQAIWLLNKYNLQIKYS